MKTLLQCAAVWIIFTCVPGFYGIIRFSRFDPFAPWPFFSLVMAVLMETALLWSLILEIKTLTQAVCGGALLGSGLPIIAAYLLQKSMADYDSWSLVPGALIVAIPGALGGAIAGWNQWRSK